MRIIFFNHKGGVSKTTTTYHLGWKLAELGSRVLLVDADPQCNLSLLIMGDSFEEYYVNDETKDRNLKSGVSPAFDGKPEPITGFSCYQSTGNTNLFLLPGHPNLTELEPPLSFAQTSNNAFSAMQNLPGAFHSLIEKCCSIHQIDYVLIDLNPGLGAINQNFFSISDLFVIPTNPDPFSLMAVKTLADVLPRWYRNSRDMRALFASSAYPFPTMDPKFGGILIQRFNIRNGAPAAPFRDNISEIIEAVQNELVPALRQNNMLLDEEIYNGIGIGSNFCLSEIADFQSLLPRAHSAGIPVYALSDPQLGTGPVLEQLSEKRQLFNNLFVEFQQKIVTIKTHVSS